MRKQRARKIDKLEEEMKYLMGGMLTLIVLAFTLWLYTPLVQEIQNAKEVADSIEAYVEDNKELEVQQEKTTTTKSNELQEVDVTLLKELTFENVTKHYEQVLSKEEVTTDQFKYVLVETFAKDLIATLEEKMNGREIPKQLSFDMYVNSHRILYYISSVGVYTDQELYNSSWSSLLTSMALLEVHATDFKEYPNRKEVEINHLGTLAIALVSQESFDKLGYMLTDETHIALSEFIVSEKFNKVFSQSTTTLKEYYEEKDKESEEDK